MKGAYWEARPPLTPYKPHSVPRLYSVLSVQWISHCMYCLEAYYTEFLRNIRNKVCVSCVMPPNLDCACRLPLV